ncbi:MAG: peptidoglycan DD-metalloendopeptidase family protein [Gammaproteobacteria bacterium AqS3]|nr:peptidoglycan DD-metalloendopeptidase family protein [Gammaproteobacteria bacterium AqS3]
MSSTVRCQAALLVLLICTAAAAPAARAEPASLPSEARIPGGIALIELPSRRIARRATFQDRPVLAVGRTAVVAIPLNTAPGDYALKSGKREYRFSVSEHVYPESRITLQGEKREMVDVPEERLVRIRSDHRAIRGAYATRDENVPLLRLNLPAEGPWSSRYGLKRFFNGKQRSPHTGLDIAAPTGTPVYAAAAGEVVASDDYYFNGHTVIVHHGGGLVTLYCHLSERLVEAGATVEAGQLIGRVGSSGRASGAHLHWSVSLSNVRVDPELFVDPEVRAAQSAD